MASISFNPQLTTSPSNTFLTSTEGYVQGATLDDTSARMWLNSGVIASTVTQPVWGGMAITESVPASNSLGGNLTIASAAANVTGFTVFDQAHNMIIVPGNSVQQSLAGMTAHYFRLGSNIRIAVQCDATLANNLAGGAINQQVSWDFTNQKLIAFASTALPVKVLSVSATSKIVSYNSGTGALTWTVGAAAIIQL